MSAEGHPSTSATIEPTVEAQSTDNTPRESKWIPEQTFRFRQESPSTSCCHHCHPTCPISGKAATRARGKRGRGAANSRKRATLPSRPILHTEESRDIGATPFSLSE